MHLNKSEPRRRSFNDEYRAALSERFRAPFQVPRLIGVSWRAPFLHDGCATTLADRFGRCATAGHGVISSLGTQDIGDLVNYLETL